MPFPFSVSLKEKFVAAKEKLSTTKGKLIAAGFVGFNAVNAAAADVAIAADGTVSGTIDPKTFMGMAGVVVALLGVIYGVKKGLSLLR